MKSSLSIALSEDGKVSFNLKKLLRTRALIQAGSGGGKSWLLRRLAEQLFGKVQVIIIDPEGEFSSLREKFGYVLVSNDGGDTPADPRSAALLAHKLLELNASAVCDLFEMHKPDRHLWMRNFCDAMVNAPKKLWHPVVFIIDEAHVFMPEDGNSVASTAAIDLTTLGRKRGFCVLMATQRLSKLSKDASAELFNCLVGGTFIDIDRDRAIDCLGISKSKDERAEVSATLKMMEPGEFFAIGRAIGIHRTKFKVGSVQTTHPEEGSKVTSKATPAPGQIQHLLPQLADLPKAAEEQAITVAALKAEVSALKRQLAATKVQAAPVVTAPYKPNPAVLAGIRQRTARLNRLYEENNEAIRRNLKDFTDGIAAELALLEGANKTPMAKSYVIDRLPPRPVEQPVRMIVPKPVRTPAEGDFNVNGGMRRMMTALAQRPGLNAKRLGVRAGLSSKSGTFATYLGKLRSSGFVTGERSSGFTLTPEGQTALGAYDPLPEGHALFQYWMNELGDSGAGRMLTALRDAHPNALTKEELGKAADISHVSGTFATYLGKLRSLELVEGKNPLQCSAELFD